MTNNDITVIWHLLDEPNSPEAMAAALPLSGVDTHRLYLPLPFPEGDFGALAAEDVVANVFGPITANAVAALPAQIAEFRREHGLDEGRITLVGGSLGALIALKAATTVPADAIVLVAPVVQLAALVAANEQAFGMTYTWTEPTRELAEQLDFVAHADTLTPPLLLVTGEQDPLGESAEQLWKARPDNTSLVIVPGLGHGISDEVDGIVADWLRRQLA